jgi:hypothetical protein
MQSPSHQERENELIYIVWGIKVVALVATILIVYPALCRMTIQIYFEERKKND